MNKRSDSFPESRGAAPQGWDAIVSQAAREDVRSASEAVREPGGPRRSYLRWILPTLAGASLLAGVPLLLWFWAEQARPPDEAELDRGRRALLSLVDDSLEQEMRMHGTYPENLDDAFPMHVDVQYRREGAGYELSVRLGDGRLLTVKKP